MIGYAECSSERKTKERQNKKKGRRDDEGEPEELRGTL